ncbi:hypothetical protein Anapl_01610 [Anas platyrhynchos]|uniref:Uncharacterized protein n=1 Tax=Anas platyrhynchos TaxID=8839 RepID=R0JYR5_ANAPL|nr:hypothetical protein Anapl_01610 [Anas platyrhynchos]
MTLPPRRVGWGVPPCAPVGISHPANTQRPPTQQDFSTHQGSATIGLHHRKCASSSAPISTPLKLADSGRMETHVGFTLQADDPHQEPSNYPAGGCGLNWP